MSPALVGGFLTTAPPGKPNLRFLVSLYPTSVFVVVVVVNSVLKGIHRLVVKGMVSGISCLC